MPKGTFMYTWEGKCLKGDDKKKHFTAALSTNTVFKYYLSNIWIVLCDRLSQGNVVL